MAPEPRSGDAWRLAAILTSFVVTGACATATTPDASGPSAPQASPSATPAAPAAPAEPAVDAPPPSTAAAAPAAPARKLPADAAECKAMVASKDLAKSDAKVTPGEGAGKSDRFAGIVAAIKDKRPALRCCYELWSRDNPRKDARVVLDFLLDEEGLPTEVQLLRAKGDKLGDDIEACIVDVAMAIPYPKSPSARTTTFEYELGFKHHKAPVADR